MLRTIYHAKTSCFVPNLTIHSRSLSLLRRCCKFRSREARLLNRTAAEERTRHAAARPSEQQKHRDPGRRRVLRLLPIWQARRRHSGDRCMHRRGDTNPAGRNHVLAAHCSTRFYRSASRAWSYLCVQEPTIESYDEPCIGGHEVEPRHLVLAS